jgi:hypothetical protein
MKRFVRGRGRGWLPAWSVVALILSALSLVAPFASAQAMAAAAAPPGPPWVGWAVEAYPEMPAAEMEAMVRRLVAHGANVVWIGHNNPGEVDPSKVEPGLSYAVYEALLDPSDPRHVGAVAMLAAQRRLLDACRAVGVPAVLPVGYQIQMGRRWNKEHPADLRRDAAGRPLDIYGGGVSASFYAPSYRRDIEAYYRWLDRELVRPYAGTILMLNLADEPLGGDYSAHAEAEFRARTGLGFSDVGDDVERQRLLGAFQSGMVAEYAAWSAALWHAIHPGLPVTMSFDGAQARKTYTLPDLEPLFRDTPSNFVVTFDAYPRDGLPHVALSDADLVGLYLLARSVGLYSARYGKPVWLWAAANSWGLSQASRDPGSVSDAVTNGLALALLTRQGGGDLQGIAYWNYNVKEQGLYNDTHRTAYDVETMFQRVTAAFPSLRQAMAARSSRPEVLILAPPLRAHEAIGAERTAVIQEVHPFQRLTILAAQGVNAVVVGSLEGWLAEMGEDGAGPGLRCVVVLTPSAAYLQAGDVAALRQVLAAGGRAVVAADVARALGSPAPVVPRLAYGQLVERRGNLYVAAHGVAMLFEAGREGELDVLWREVLGLEAVQPGYRIVTRSHALVYHRGPEAADVQLSLPFTGYGHRYDEHGRPVQWFYGDALETTLARREFLFLKRDPWAGPPWVRAPGKRPT